MNGRMSRTAASFAAAAASAVVFTGMGAAASAAPAEGAVVQAKEHYAGQYIVVLKDSAEATGSGAAIESTAKSLVGGYGGRLASVYRTTLHGYYGVAKKAKLVALRVLDCGNQGPDSLLVDAIEWVTVNGVKPAVVTISIGQFEVGVGDEQVQASIRAGFPYVVAAGNNNGGDACGVSPARVPEAITVASTDNRDARSSFSNVGTCVDIFAPGSNITSLSQSSDTGTAGNSGTSMATPHVSSAAALYLQGHPSASPAEVTKAILDAATVGKVTSPGTGSPNKLLYTKGLGGAPPSPACAQQTNDTDVAIPDAGAVVSSTITVSGCPGNASSTSPVEVAIAHPYRGDLVVDLIAPDGTSYRLKPAAAGDAGDDVRTTFTANVSAEVRNGTWKLSVQDVYRYDTGTLESWSLTL